ASARGTTYDTYYTDKEYRKKFKGCREFSDVLVYDGIVQVSSRANPTSPAVELHSGQKTTVPCGLALLPATALAAPGTSVGTAGGVAGLSTATVAAASLGSVAIIGGAVIGGYAAAGGLSSTGSSSTSATTNTATAAITPMM